MSGEPLLIVDDNATNLKLLSFVLVKQGYEIRSAADAEEALAILGDWRPRMILLDLQLPGMDGLKFAQQLKADPATRPIIILAVTAYAMKGDERTALEAGCDAYLTKPIDTRALPAVIAKLLETGARPTGAGGETNR
jgi:CheY-like chemotaxis protein